MNKIQKLKELINTSKDIVIFTGAGISVPSGIPDFRSSNGLYSEKGDNNISPEEIISHHFFVNHTKEFYNFYKKKMIYPNALPNVAHKYFQKLEENNKKVTIVTQNIDGLHDSAGSKKVLELHGSVLRNYCMKCQKFHNINKIISAIDVPYCECGGIIKPDVILYEEQLDYKTLYSAINEIKKADLIIVIGTSLVVQPAASLLQYRNTDNLVLINKEKTAYDKYAELVFNKDVIEVILELEKV